MSLVTLGNSEESTIMLEIRTRSSSELPNDFDVMLLSDAGEAVSPVYGPGVRVVTAVVCVRCADCSSSRIRRRAEDSDATIATWLWIE